MENKKYWLFFIEGQIENCEECESLQAAEEFAHNLAIENPGKNIDILESIQTVCGTVNVDTVNHFSDKEE